MDGIRKAMFSTGSTPERKKAREGEGPAEDQEPQEPELNPRDQALVDAMSNRMASIMDDKLTLYEKKTDDKIASVQKQVDDTSKEIKALHAKTDATAQQVQQLQQTIESMKIKPSGNDRNLQLVAHGFQPDTNETTVVDYLTKLTKDKNYQDRVHHIFCMTDPTSVGYIEFLTLAGKNGFHKMMRESPPQAPGGQPDDRLRFTDNLTKTERRDMNQLGFTKYHLNRLLGIPLEDIRIMRDTLSVKVLGKLAATIVNGEIEYHDRGLEVKVSVSQSMREWDAKGPKN